MLSAFNLHLMSILTTINYCTLESHVNVRIYLSQTYLCQSSTYICHPNCVTPTASYTGKMYKYICTEWNIKIIIVTVKIWCTCIFCCLFCLTSREVQFPAAVQFSKQPAIRAIQAHKIVVQFFSSIYFVIIISFKLQKWLCKQQEMKMMCI